MNSAELIIYEKPTCTTSKKAVALLVERGIEFEGVNYFVDRFSAAKIAELLDKAGITPRELLRTRATAFKELGLADSDHSDLDLIQLMADDPELIERPIAEKGGRAVLCRPYERVLEIL
ncbi:MAG: arsenate reductase [Solirubrobacterales bacterium]|nr:arsenate reductase [Solirubrobacterales bacterium]